MIYKKFYLFGPSVIDPKAINAEYFAFQSWDYKF